jgi:hypothetical protein
MQTNNGKKGGLLKGKAHYDKNGKPLGGIKAVVTDSGQQVELEGGEVIINKEASKKHWKELSRINQSAGNGVPILPPDETDTDVDSEDFEKGGKIDFNPNKVPSKKIYNYAKKIKEKYPKVWDMGGNIFGNEAYKNLERALKRGYWLDSEDWMYKKWQSFNARHSGDIRIAGIIANLKWLNVVDKGWQYMTNLIEEEIEKKYGDNKMAKGGKTEILSPQGILISKDKKSKLDYKKVGDNYEFLVFDGEANPVENYTRTQFKKRNGKSIVMTYQQFINFLYNEGYIDDKMAKGGVVTYRDKYNKKYDYEKGTSHDLDEISDDTGKSKKGLQQIYNKGIGAYKTNPQSVRPNVKSKEQWAMGRVYSAVMGGKASKVDAKELKMGRGGNTNQKITCENCGWTWNTKDSAEFDKYVCHNCGFDNSGFYAKSGKTNNINCIDFINQSDALQNNGYLYYFKNILVYCESGQSIPNVKSFCLITYNSGGQKNLKITDTINAIELSNELHKIVGSDKSVARILLNEFLTKAKKIDTSDLSRLKNENIIIADRNNIVCNNIKFAKGGITGDYFSMADKEQFNQLMSLLNELIEKKFATDCFINDKDNSVVFLTGKNVSDIKKNQIFNFINKTLKQKYDSFTNNLNWIYADGELQGFKIYFRKDIIYAKGGELAKGIKVEKEHSKTANKLYNRKITPQQSFEQIAKDHLKEDKHYYSKLAVFENKMADGGNIDVSKFGFKTPTGKPSKLTYLQQILVRTKAFKEWFGDWESVAKEVVSKDLLNNNTTDVVLFGMYKDCSKILDFDTLEPRLVFHGTRSDDEFYKFDTNIRPTGRPYSYFAYNKEYSKNFTNKFGQDWGGMYDCFIQVKNPLVMLGQLFEDAFYDGKNWMFYIVNVIFRDKFNRPIDVKKDAEFINDIIDEIGFYVYAISQASGDSFPFWKLMGGDTNGDFKIFLQKYGYDGVIYTEEAFLVYDTSNPAHYTKAVTIFESNQVKLGDGRNVDFSKNTDDIRYKKGGMTEVTQNYKDYTHHQSLAKSIFGDGGQIVQNQKLEMMADTISKSNREFVEDLIKKMQ